MILRFYAGKSHNLIGLGIFMEISTFLICKFRDKTSLDLHEKSFDLSNYEIFPHKILKSRTFKKSSILIVKINKKLLFYTVLVLVPLSLRYSNRYRHTVCSGKVLNKNPHFRMKIVPLDWLL